MALPASQVAGRSTAANKLAAEKAEEELFERAGLEAPDDEPGPSAGQKALAAEEYKHLPDSELLKVNTRYSKQALGQVMGFRRELSGFRTVQQMHSSTLHEICDTLAAINRKLETFEQHGILPGELAANPDLNPMLGKCRKRVGLRSCCFITKSVPFTLSFVPAFHDPAASNQILRKLGANRRVAEVRDPQQRLLPTWIRARHHTPDVQPGIPEAVQLSRRPAVRELDLHSGQVRRKPVDFRLIVH